MENPSSTNVHQVQLPPGLTYLRFGHRFNQDISGLNLPDTLQYLELGKDFQHDLRRLHLPQSLQELRLHSYFRFWSAEMGMGMTMANPIQDPAPVIEHRLTEWQEWQPAELPAGCMLTWRGGSRVQKWQ